MSDATETGIQYPTAGALIEHLEMGHRVHLSADITEAPDANRAFMLQAHERFHSRPDVSGHQHREEWR